MTTQNTQQADGLPVLFPALLPGAAIVGTGFSIPLLSAPTAFPSALMIPIGAWWVVAIFVGRSRLRREKQRSWEHGHLATSRRAYLPAWQQIAFAVCIAISVLLGRGTTGGRLGATAAVVGAACLAMAIHNAYEKHVQTMKRINDARIKGRTAIEKVAPGGQIPFDEWRVFFQHMGLDDRFRLMGIDALPGGDARLRFRGAPGTHRGQIQSLNEAIAHQWALTRVSEAQFDPGTGHIYVIATMTPEPEQAEPEDEWS